MAFRINGVDVKVSDSEKLNGATESATATANTIAKRDASGRIKAAAAVASDDVVIKSQLDAVGPTSPFTEYENGTLAYQLFTSSGTFTVPAGVTKLYVAVIGGGGAGGGATSGSRGGRAGGCGGLAKGFVSISSGQSVVVTVGTGGVGSTGTGTAGGASSFGAYMSATGGSGGAANVVHSWSVSTTGGVGSGGEINFVGTSTSSLIRRDCGSGKSSYTVRSYHAYFPNVFSHVFDALSPPPAPSAGGGVCPTITSITSISSQTHLQVPSAGTVGSFFYPRDALSDISLRVRAGTLLDDPISAKYDRLTDGDISGVTFTNTYGVGGTGGYRASSNRSGGAGRPGVVLVVWEK
jgi:hypothetical protein